MVHYSCQLHFLSSLSVRQIAIILQKLCESEPDFTFYMNPLERPDEGKIVHDIGVSSKKSGCSFVLRFGPNQDRGSILEAKHGLVYFDTTDSIAEKGNLIQISWEESLGHSFEWARRIEEAANSKLPSNAA